MMLEQTLDELVGKVGNRYALVAIISKRSRQIVDEAAKDELEEINPVSESVGDLVDDRINWHYGSDLV